VHTPDLAALDPAPIEVMASADDPRLARILATDPAEADLGALPDGHRPRRAWLVGGGVALAAIAAAVAVALFVPSAVPPAFAGWTPAPDPSVPAAEQRALQDLCSYVDGRPVDFQTASFEVDGQQIPGEFRTSTSIVDRRGSYRMMLVGSVWVPDVSGVTFAASAVSLCGNLTPAGPAHAWVNMGLSYEPATWSVPAGSIAVMTGDMGPVFGDPALSPADAPYFQIAVGVAGADVRRVQAVTNLGQIIDASLQGGYWLVYGPVDEAAAIAAGTGLLSYIVTLGDGTTRVLTMRTLTGCEGVAAGGQALDGLSCGWHGDAPVGVMPNTVPEAAENPVRPGSYNVHSARRVGILVDDQRRCTILGDAAVAASHGFTRNPDGTCAYSA